MSSILQESCRKREYFSPLERKKLKQNKSLKKTICTTIFHLIHPSFRYLDYSNYGSVWVGCGIYSRKSSQLPPKYSPIHAELFLRVDVRPKKSLHFANNYSFVMAISVLKLVLKDVEQNFFRQA